MKYARIENEIVAEVIDLPNDTPVENMFHPNVLAHMVQCDDDVQVGWLHKGKQFSAPPPLTPPFDTNSVISDQQFYQGLAVEGVITQQEALAAVMNGTIPPALEKVVTKLPKEEQFSARMFLSGKSEYRRNHNLVSKIGDSLKWKDDKMNNFWRFCAGL